MALDRPDGHGASGVLPHEWLERLLARARYAEGKHSATRIHPELQDLKVGDSVPMAAGVLARGGRDRALQVSRC